MEIKKILFAADFPGKTVKAVSFAADLAKRYGARLYIVHVVQDLEKMTEWYAPRVNMDELHRTMESKALRELERCVKESGGHGDIEYRLLKGSPHAEILKFKRDNDIEMIVLGTSGGVADKIIKESRRPVLIVEPREEKPESMSARLCSGGTEIRL
ncbi:MAG TPA: universal stress protein [Thermodesulfovibrionales bacterium]|nr:universal stress protein [Thermodesulfovibrionales bacterium]